MEIKSDLCCCTQSYAVCNTHMVTLAYNVLQHQYIALLSYVFLYNFSELLANILFVFCIFCSSILYNVVLHQVLQGMQEQGCI